MEVIILAGGMGTRLREVVDDLPKPMAPVNGKPFLYYLLHWLKQYQIEKILLSTGYRSESVINFFGDSFSGIPIKYVVEDKPLGTGGAVKYALQKTTGENILILNGDTYFPIDLERFCTFHSENTSLFSVALKRMLNFSRYGSVDCPGDTIIRFNEKKFCTDGVINGGIYLMNRQFFESKKLTDVFSLEQDILEKEASNYTLKGMVFDELFIDIGIPEDYHKAASFLTIR
jgi:D-glycero-alpha-D-manno-heptose 1-phosphate guanylyltransferase